VKWTVISAILSSVDSNFQKASQKYAARTISLTVRTSKLRTRCTTQAEIPFGAMFDGYYRRNGKTQSSPIGTAEKEFLFSLYWYSCEFSSILFVAVLKDFENSQKSQLRTRSTAALTNIIIGVLFDGLYRENERAPSSPLETIGRKFLFSFHCYSCKFSSFLVVVEIKKLEKAKNPNVNVHNFFFKSLITRFLWRISSFVGMWIFDPYAKKLNFPKIAGRTF
jgi:hypothetical protein